MSLHSREIAPSPNRIASTPLTRNGTHLMRLDAGMKRADSTVGAAETLSSTRRPAFVRQGRLTLTIRVYLVLVAITSIFAHGGGARAQDGERAPDTCLLYT